MYGSIDINQIDTVNINDNLIDIRDKYQYKLSHIPRARNVPYMYLMMMPEDYLNRKDTFYFYCGSGNRSRKICEHLSELEYKVVDLMGGYDSYKNKV